MSERTRTALCLAVVALASLAVVWPLYDVYWFESHDMVAYPVRVIEYVQGWRQGYWYPRWGSDLYGGYGSPLFNFYPPGVHGLAGAISLLGPPPTAALKYTLLFYNALGALGVFLVVFHETRRRDAALVAVVAFLFMPYRLTQLYVRGDLAEFSAISLVPISLWLYRTLLSRPGNARFLGPAAVVAHAAVAMTHTLTGQWYTELAGLFVLVEVLRRWRARQPLPWTAMLALVGALTTAAIYLLPAFFDREWVNVGVMTEGKLQTTQNMVDLLWLVSPGFFFAGFTIMAALPVGITVAITRRGNQVAPWAAVTAVMVLLMYHRSAPLWAFVPFGRYLMFPWRLLGFVAVFGSLMVGGLWSMAVSDGRLPRVATALMLLALGTLGWSSMPPVVNVADKLVPQDAQQVAQGMHSTVVFHEYIPGGSAPPAAPRHRFADPNPRAEIISSIQSSAGYLFTLNTYGANTGVTLANYWFPGWTVRTLEGPAEAELAPSTGKMIELKFPVAGQYRVRVSFVSTPLHSAATAFTLISLLLLVLWMARPEWAAALIARIRRR